MCSTWLSDYVLHEAEEEHRSGGDCGCSAHSLVRSASSPRTTSCRTTIDAVERHVGWRRRTDLVRAVQRPTGLTPTAFRELSPEAAEAMRQRVKALLARSRSRHQVSTLPAGDT